MYLLVGIIGPTFGGLAYTYIPSLDPRHGLWRRYIHTPYRCNGHVTDIRWSPYVQLKWSTDDAQNRH